MVIWLHNNDKAQRKTRDQYRQHWNCSLVITINLLTWQKINFSLNCHKTDCFPLINCIVYQKEEDDSCERSPPGLGQLNCWPDEQRRELHFLIGIIQGTIPSGFPVSWVVIPGCSRNDSGASPYLRVQKKFIEFWQSTQNTWLRPTKFLR